MVEVWTLVVVENMTVNRDEVVETMKKLLWKKFGVAVEVFSSDRELR
jgi:hypothetical protein